MNIEINPKLVPFLRQLAEGQGMTEEQYTVHVVEKYLAGQERSYTETLLRSLSSDEVTDIRSNLEVIIEAKKKPEDVKK